MEVWINDWYYKKKEFEPKKIFGKKRFKKSLEKYPILENKDIFSVDFQNQYYKKFGIVISRNVIEHFYNLNQVINIHKDLLKNGG